MRAKIARKIEQFVGDEIGRRHAMRRLLIGGLSNR
jgi:hypothetical protein